MSNISPIYPAQRNGFAFALIDSKIYLVEFLAFFSQNSSGNFHSYINQPITDVDTIGYVSSMVFLQLRNNLFYKPVWEGKFLFSHLSSKQILYYVGN